MGRLEEASDFRFGCPRKGTPNVPEELTFDERLGNRRAIDGNERTLPAQRSRVKLPGHDFLADAGLAQEKHRQIARRDQVDHGVHATHRLVVNDDAVATRIPGRSTSVAQPG